MTGKEISDRILKRIDDDPNNPGSVAPDPNGGPVPPEILAAINEGQELFALLTLCLETTTTITLVANTTFSIITATLPDFLAPLRLTVAGARVRPATLAQLDAENDAWQITAGTPRRYAILGFNFQCITPQPTVDTAAQITYARSPAPVVGDRWPEIPEQYHQSLVKYGIYKARLKEGGQGLERGLVQFNEFLGDATAHGDYVRAKSRAATYDTLPFELQLFDRGRVQKAKKQ